MTGSRWRYLKWLTYALYNWLPEDFLTIWSDLVTTFHLPQRDSWTFGLATDFDGFQLTEEQWALVDPVLTGSEHGSVYQRRASIEALCLKMAMDRPLEQLGLDWIYNSSTRWNAEY